jgi:hypothetical protein
MKEWIDHMRHNMGEDVAEPANDEESKVDVNVGLDDLDSDSISFELKCNECSIEQLFRSQDALKIHMSTFHKRSKRFLCAFCHFDGNTVKDLNRYVCHDSEVFLIDKFLYIIVTSILNMRATLTSAQSVILKLGPIQF